MGKIHVLPEVLAHQIAAGEIVERPASVVKELIENALDAEASRIDVEVQEGGKSYIRVRDDGQGMSREDVLLALEHHATSKIRCAEDLASIRTLGFRGEALPSIASVSRIKLRTISDSKIDQNPIGTEVTLVGGKERTVGDTAWPRGTEVIVEDLFFNIPARKKFLKTVATEIGHISRHVLLYAVARPEVAFHLEHRGRKLIDAPSAASLKQRIVQVLGKGFDQNLVPLRYSEEDVSLTGYTSLPHEQRSSAHSLFLFVNGRAVRDRILTHAIRQAYRDLIPSSAYPVVILFVEVPAGSLDVNVHPCKTEVRFRNSQSVHQAITRAIDEALVLNEKSLSSLARDIPFNGSITQARRATVSQSMDRFFQRTPDSSFGFPAFRSRNTFSWPARSEQISSPAVAENGADPHASDIPETAYLSAVPSVLGQFVESFILAADREGVMLVDQHVAHERILYDGALREMESDKKVPAQRLLQPLTLDLNPQQIALAEELMEHLNQSGFEVEWFGSRTLAVRAIPAISARADAGHLMEGLIHEMETLDRIPKPDERSAEDVRRVREKIAITLACRAAIKINTPLSAEKMQWLIDELFRCENPYTCPHGRPIVLRMNVAEILKGFKRI